MGGGASKGKAVKGKSKDAEALLKKAQESDEEAKTLFEKIDVNKDGKLSVKELHTAVASYGKELKATWSNEQIDVVIKFFDRDHDGMLDLAEFTDVMHELKERGSIDGASLEARAAAAAEAAKRQAEVKPVWDKNVKDGGIWDRGCTGKVIRELNDQENYWDDFGAKVTSAHAMLTGVEDKKATATFEQVVDWYPKLLAEVALIKQEWDAAAAATKAAQAQAKADEFAPTKAEWEVTMKRLPEALDAAWKVGKTALLVDVTTPPGENKNAAFSPLENFYSYSGDTLIELKKAVVEVNVKKEKTLEEVQGEFAKKTLLALKQGRPLTLLCSNSAPPLKSKFAGKLFPLELFDAPKLKALLGDQAPDLAADQSFLKDVMQFMKDNNLDKDPSYNAVIGHDKFRVYVVTKFDPADYSDFLKEEWPLDLMQPIKVYSES